jgi:hypothetical protein
MSTLEQDVRDRVEVFVADLDRIIRRQALAAVGELLGGDAPRAQKAETPAAPAPVARLAPKGQKRDPRVLEVLVERLFGYIKGHPAQRIEQIGKEMGIATRELNLPIKKLIRSKRIKATGVKRATTYA